MVGGGGGRRAYFWALGAKLKWVAAGWCYLNCLLFPYLSALKPLSTKMSGPTVFLPSELDVSKIGVRAIKALSNGAKIASIS